MEAQPNLADGHWLWQRCWVILIVTPSLGGIIFSVPVMAEVSQGTITPETSE
jgi:hypothetical protein